MTVESSAAEATLATLEEVFTLYHTQLGLAEPFAEQVMQYKTRVYVYQTIGALFRQMGSYA